ncbi:hypothetical protein C8Q75DRAFT_732687 [Abortiporus biennis]|nr:hypothetical protein C8Q75DRAFT_732687 [Abortiporus biennis]
MVFQPQIEGFALVYYNMLSSDDDGCFRDDENRILMWYTTLNVVIDNAPPGYRILERWLFLLKFAPVFCIARLHGCSLPQPLVKLYDNGGHLTVDGIQTHLSSWRGVSAELFSRKKAENPMLNHAIVKQASRLQDKRSMSAISVLEDIWRHVAEEGQVLINHGKVLLCNRLLDMDAKSLEDSQLWQQVDIFDPNTKTAPTANTLRVVLYCKLARRKHSEKPK